MRKYARGFHRPNQNTNGAYRDFRRNLDLLEEDLFKLIEKYAIAENHAPIHQLRNDMKNLSARIDELAPYCTLSIQLPDVQGTVLKNLDCPSLHISKWVSPGYFTTIKKIRVHVLNHPVRGSYYLTLVLGNLDKEEPAAHAVVTQGKPPEILEELFSRLAFA